MASSATSGKRITFNNMEGKPLPLPISMDLGPGEEMELRLELQMMTGMDGPHQFRLPVFVGREPAALTLSVQGLFR